MKPSRAATAIVLCGCLALMLSEVKSQDHFSVGDYGPTVTISEASLNNMMTRLEALEASMGEEGQEDGWEDVSQEKWKVTWGGRVMLDCVNWADQDPGYGGANAGQNYLEMRRARFRADGEGYGIYFWQIELDFAADDDSSAEYNAGGPGLISVGPVVEMKDVYVGIQEIPLLGTVLIGHFKGPFSIEELTSSRYITFLERALPNYFVPSREVGIAAYNRSVCENVLWGFGVFADGVPETTKQLVDHNIGTQVVGRVTWTPYYDEPSDGRYLLHLGAGFRHVQDRDGMYNLRVRPETHESVRLIDFDGDNDRANHHTVYNAEMAWVHGPFSIQAEGFVDVVDVVGVGNTNAYAAYAQASYFLTGENRVYKRSRGTFSRVKPHTNFWLARGAGVGPGAWELKARWSHMDVDNLYAAGFTGDADENAEQVNNVAVGFNWYWNPYTRMMFDYSHSWSKRPGLVADNADLIGMRMQYDF